jgi:DNA modification methylase
MELIKKKVSDLIPYINNSRTHSEEQITQLISSIKEFGFTNPILLSPDNSIIAGHGRLQAVKRLGHEEVPCIIISGLTKTQIKALIIADNQLALNAGWDLEKLSVEIEGLEADKFDISLLGFEDKFLQGLKAEGEGLIADDEIPEIKENPKNKLEDIWVLGDHRLICGDSTDQKYYNLLLKDKKANMVFTDPPYGLNYEYNTHKDVAGKEYLEFCDKWFPLLKEYSNFIFLTAGWKYNKFWLMKEPDDIFYWISRNKQSGGKLSYFRKIEPIFLWGKTKNKYNLDYFDYNSDRLDKLREHHTCPKPVKFVIDALSAYDENSIILDVFLGSGTTIIACEKTRKICYGIEKDPKYCDLIIDRWQQFTGKEAIHEQSGKTYNSI